jgi:hypothetical protein
VSFLAVAIIVAGIAVAFVLGLVSGFDSVGIVIFLLILLVGALGVAAVMRFRSGEVAPARCRECGGVISPNAPSCKHCGAAAVLDH